MSHRLPLADIQFIADFAAFCRSKEGEVYIYLATDNCACAQFLRASGKAKHPAVAGYGWRDDDGGYHPFTDELTAAVSNRANGWHHSGHTFSALADRLEALIADAPMVAK